MYNKRRGSALPELVIVQVLMLIVFMVGFSAIGAVTRTTFSGTTDVLDMDGDSAAVASATPAAGPSAPMTDNSADAPDFGWLLIPTCLFVVLTTCLYLVFRRYRNQRGVLKRGQSKEHVLPEDRESLPSERLKEKREQVASILSENWQSIFDNKLTVRHFMTQSVTVVSPGDSIAKIRDLVQDKHFRHLIVKDEAGDVVGVISDRDEILDDDRKAGDVMTGNPILVHQDIPVMSAVSQMIANRISCLPVVGSDGLVGILTTSDVMIAFQCTLRTLEKIRRTLHTESPAENKSEHSEATVAPVAHPAINCTASPENVPVTSSAN